MGEEVFHASFMGHPFRFLVDLMFVLFFCYSALDSDDLLYLKEQMEAEEDAERLLRRTEKRAFAAFKISFVELHIITSIFLLCTQEYNLINSFSILLYQHETFQIFAILCNRNGILPICFL